MRFFDVLLTSNPYENFGKQNTAGIYENLGDATLYAEVGVFRIIMTAGVYIAVICFMVSAILLIIGSKEKGGKLAQYKAYVIRVMVCSALFFAVAEIINLVQAIGLDH